MASLNSTLRLNVYGITIEVQSHDQRIIDDIDHDFHYFVTSEPCSPALTLCCLPERRRSSRRWGIATSRSRLFLSRGGFQEVEFFRKALVRYDFKRGRSLLYCNDPAVAYETAYMVLCSFIGESLDGQGWHRIHGLGFEHRGIGTLLLAASGGGKSTLAMRSLQRTEFRLLSDDTPLVGANGVARALPLRIALREKPAVEERYLRKFARVGQGEKFVIGSSFFTKKICKETVIRRLALLKKATGASSWERLPKTRLVWPLCRWLVLGHETPQIWELYLRASPKDIAQKTAILFSRMRAAFQLWRGCEAWTFRQSLGGEPPPLAPPSLSAGQELLGDIDRGILKARRAMDAREVDA